MDSQPERRKLAAPSQTRSARGTPPGQRSGRRTQGLWLDRSNPRPESVGGRLEGRWTGLAVSLEWSCHARVAVRSTCRLLSPAQHLLTSSIRSNRKACHSRLKPLCPSDSYDFCMLVGSGISLCCDGPYRRCFCESPQRSGDHDLRGQYCLTCASTSLTEVPKPSGKTGPVV